MRLREEDLPIRAGVVLYDDNLDVLIVHPLGQSKSRWDFPKGHFDTKHDTSLDDTAIRELEEETGIHVSDSELIFQNGGDFTEGDYNGTKLRLYFVHRRVVDASKCKCYSLIGDDCPQVWKRGLPENDKFQLVHWNKLRDWIFKSYSRSNLLGDIEDFFDSLEEEMERI